MDERLVEAAQALLTGYDTALNRQWREEDRLWRQADLCWRDRELKFMDQQSRWRREDIEQRHLDNARVLWGRILERNRRDVEEKSEQLKAISTLAALISGFALTAFLQFDFGPFQDRTGVALPLFGISMALTVGFETLCVIICSLMLVSVFKTGKKYVSDEEEAEFMARCRDFIRDYRPGDRPPAPRCSFATHWTQRCEQSWRRAFLAFGLGIPALFVNLSVAAWIKFDQSLVAAASSTVVLGASLLAMFYFHRKWTSHILDSEKIELAAEGVPVPCQGLPFDWHLRPALQSRAASSLQRVPLSQTASANPASEHC